MLAPFSISLNGESESVTQSQRITRLAKGDLLSLTFIMYVHTGSGSLP